MNRLLDLANSENNIKTIELLSYVDIILICVMGLICYYDTNIPRDYARLILYMIPALDRKSVV